MATNPQIEDKLRQIRTATYGKDVRTAIADGIKLCYNYTSGEGADAAAARANAAAATVEAIINGANEALSELESAVANVDDIVKVSETQPSASETKIWVQPQDNTEYKVATFAAYEALWSRMNDISDTYELGHGGIVSIAQDTTYSDENNPLKNRYVITYSDTTTGEFFLNNGPTGATGPVDTIANNTIYYHKGVISEGSLITTPPVGGWSTSLPELDPGDYLWTQTVVTYTSGAESYLYGLSRLGENGLNGSGAVNSVALGSGGTAMAGDIVLPADNAPTEDSGNLVLSGAVYSAIENAKVSPTFTGTPTAPTAEITDNSEQIATTEFVHNMAARRVSLTMNSTSVEYTDNFINSNTYCLFTGVQTSKFSSALSWSTTSGMLTVTTATAPSSQTSFTVILLNSEVSA